MPDASEFFEQVLDTVGVGVAVYGDDGRLAYANPAYARLLNTERESLRGTAVWEVDPSIGRESFEEVWNALDVGETRVAEATYAVDGTAVEASVVTTCDVVDGERRHVRTTVDRREREGKGEGDGEGEGEGEGGAENRTRTGEGEFQRSLLKAQQEATIDGILIVDENDEILSYNRRFAEMWDVPETLIEGKDDEPVLDRVVEQVNAPDEFLDRVEYLYDHPEEDSRDLIELTDGRKFDRYSTAVVDEDTYYGRLWVFRDVTERVERQHRLERQNERLDAFASVVSHDLRNPLNVAEGRVALAAKECDSEHLAAVERAHDRMETLIEDVLALAREGRTVEDRERVDLSTVARRGWETVGAEAATLHVDAEVAVWADESRLIQAFENLYRNAVEHGGTEVTVTVGTLPDGFYVGDDGPGIPADVREDAFDMGVTTTRDGTGFGLSIVREIVEAHGWTIDVADGSDGGARIEVTGVDLVDA